MMKYLIYFLLAISAYALPPTPRTVIVNNATGRLVGSSTNFYQTTLDLWNVQDYGATGNGLTNDTVAIQKVIDSVTNHGVVYFPPGRYVVDSLVITNALRLTASRNAVTLLVNSTNSYCIIVGNGTDAARSATFFTTIEHINFNPVSGVAVFTAGACVFLNNVAYVNVDDCVFYGLDTTTKFYNGVSMYEATDCSITHCLFSDFNNDGIVTGGATGVTNRTVDCRLDFDEFTDIGNDCVYLGPNTAGVTVNFPSMYSFSGWGIHINTVTGANGQNFFIDQPDIECDGSSGGVYVQGGGSVQVTGGWLGALSTNQYCVQVDATASDVSVVGAKVDGMVYLNGPACQILDCSVTGDIITPPVGITVDAGATSTLISGCRIRQVSNYGILFTNNPSGCLVSGSTFKNIGTLEVMGQSFAALYNPPQIFDCQTDASFLLSTNTPSLPLHVGRYFYQVIDTNTITSMTALGLGQRVTIQSGLSNITFATGGNILPKSASLSVTNGHTISFMCDGINWFQDGDNF